MFICASPTSRVVALSLPHTRRAGASARSGRHARERGDLVGHALRLVERHEGAAALDLDQPGVRERVAAAAGRSRCWKNRSAAPQTSRTGLVERAAAGSRRRAGRACRCRP